MGSQSHQESSGITTIDDIMSILNLASGSISADTAFSSLSSHLIYALRQEMGDRKRLGEIADAVNLYQIQQEPFSLGMLAVKSRSGNRFEGSIGACPIAAFLSQDPLFDEGGKYRAWQAFVIAIIFSNESLGEKQLRKFGRICDELRRAAQIGPRSEVILSLPKLTVSEGMVDRELERKLSYYMPGQVLNKEVQETITALRWLLKKAKELKEALPPPPPFSFRIDKPISAIRMSAEYPVETEEGLVNVDEVFIVEQESIWESESYYTCQDEGFGIESCLEDEDDGGVSSSVKAELQSGSEAAAARSSYWLRRAQRATLVDRNILDTLDKGIFSGWLAGELNSQAIGDGDKFACVLGLSFCLGMPLVSVASLKYGENYDLSSLGYSKIIALPEGGFVPDEGNLTIYHPITTKIQLPFVGCIEGWFSRHCSSDDEGKTLSELFGLSADEVQEGGEAALQRLRKKHPKTRINLRKLSSHLATEVSAVTKDPVIVYLLTGVANQKTPITSYYQIMSEAWLIEVYKEIILSMLPNDHA